MIGHHGANPGHLQPNGHAQLPPQPKNSSQRLTEVNEGTWLQIGPSYQVSAIFKALL